SHHWDGMANITLQTDRFILRVEMLPVMAAETTRRLDMSKVIRMRGPIHLLIMKYCSVVNILDCLNSSSDLLTVTNIILAGLIGFTQFIKRGKGFCSRFIFPEEYFHSLLMDEWNTRVNPSARHGRIYGIFRHRKFMRDPVMASRTVHGLELAFIQFRRIEARL